MNNLRLWRVSVTQGDVPRAFYTVITRVADREEARRSIMNAVLFSNATLLIQEVELTKDAADIRMLIAHPDMLLEEIA